MKPIIEINQVGKKYKIGTREPYLSLRDSLMQAVNFKRKTSEEFWALQDVSFDIMPGESLGIIGRNGAGKSTLLKILSQITPPTTGGITMHGRVASLLEVGTGFHPELTGRENIFLNGAILGMSQVEIRSKFEEIVEFAEIAKFIDTPVKRYSSGMYVRLAFAVAAHLEPEILIVDEVLAVGDVAFQQKCLGKMSEVTKKDGRTILFVSHNLVTIQNLCSQTVLLEKGRLKAYGPTKEIIKLYTDDRASQTAAVAKELSSSDSGVHFTEVTVSNQRSEAVVKTGDNLHISLGYSSERAKLIADARVVITINSQATQQAVVRLDSNVTNKTFTKQLAPQGKIICQTGGVNLVEGEYSVDIDFLIGGVSSDYVKNAVNFQVETRLRDYDLKTYPDQTISDYIVPFQFKQEA